MILSAVVVIPVLVLFLLAFILIRTLSHLRPLESFEAAELLAVDAEGVCRRLAAAIRCKTVSQPDDAPPAPKTLLELHRQLEEDFPLLHTRLIKETINTSSLLFTWKGTQPDMEPALLAAHLDVVPVDPAGLTAWDSPPFAGRVADGFVWGRGALDNKSQVIAILEAVETLLKAGFQPERTMCIALGHDEETGGEHGACQIVAFLKDHGIRLAAVLDEGGAVIQGALPGVELPVALVGTAEKGYLTLELTVDAQAGSSAIPPAQTTIGILARGLARL
ncbi:MAG: M20/M25/M40 family metallo-hydrolase, partial [Anaerolineaceae bacterium]|nr:M20/M25/M40 family metallo-hydrolase [Anaerolineaceae bacterium]